MCPARALCCGGCLTARASHACRIASVSSMTNPQHQKPDMPNMTLWTAGCTRCMKKPLRLVPRVEPEDEATGDVPSMCSLLKQLLGGLGGARLQDCNTL